MGKYVTKVKPKCCDSCSYSRPHTIENGNLGKRCAKTEKINFDAENTVLPNCPLPEEQIQGYSEEEYECIRGTKNV